MELKLILGYGCLEWWNPFKTLSWFLLSWMISLGECVFCRILKPPPLSAILLRKKLLIFDLDCCWRLNGPSSTYDRGKGLVHQSLLISFHHMLRGVTSSLTYFRLLLMWQLRSNSILRLLEHPFLIWEWWGTAIHYQARRLLDSVVSHHGGDPVLEFVVA